MRKKFSNVAKVLVDARALITIILGLGGMFGLEVQESNAKITKLETQVDQFSAKAVEYKALYDSVRTSGNDLKSDFYNSILGK